MAFPDLQVQPNSGLSFPWAEYVSRVGNTGDLNAGHEGGPSATMQILINYENLQDAIPQILGFSKRFDGSFIGTENKLLRQVPMRHPRWYQMWCTRIASAKGVKLQKKERKRYGSFSTYKLVLLSLVFTRPRYPILTDNQIREEQAMTEGSNPMPIGLVYRAEWERYLDRVWTASIQILQRRGLTFKYIEGLGTGGPATQPNVAISGGIGQRIGRLHLTRKWYQVPEACIYNSDGYPTRLMEDITAGNTEVSCILGTVNKTRFWGCPPETLMYAGIQIEPIPLPMPGELMELVGETYQHQLNVTFHFDYFNPPRGVNRSNGVPPVILGPVTTVGHNCMPYSGDGRFYRVASARSVGLGLENQPPHALYEFRELFKVL